jgi:hypothetical protein
MADLFGRENSGIKVPLTADKCTINWGGTITGAVQVAVAYNQQINRRRTIGNKDAIIWATMPSGQITIQRLMTDNAGELLKAPGWNACQPGQISVSVAGCNGSGPSYTASGCVVTQYQVSAEAESLTVMDNVVVDFLQLQA